MVVLLLSYLIVCELSQNHVVLNSINEVIKQLIQKNEYINKFKIQIEMKIQISPFLPPTPQLMLLFERDSQPGSLTHARSPLGSIE